jgi:hypothetical protein
LYLLTQLDYQGPDDFSDGAGTDICDGDNVYPSDLKYCDPDGLAWLIQRTPTQEEQESHDPEMSAGGIGDQSLFEAPGIDRIGEFNLDVETITQTAIRNQDQRGYAGLPSEEDFAEALTSRDPDNLSFKDSLFFNLPVCDISKTEISNTQLNSCKFRFEGEEVR